MATLLSSTHVSFAYDCKCRYGDPCWPSEAEFAQLSSQLSQPIIRPTPPQSACYPVSNPSGNCTDVQNNGLNGTWLSDRAGSVFFPNFQEYIFPNGTISACYWNTTLGFPCEQGNIPPVGVDARSAADVQAAVRFASKHNLRLVVKNTGHDFMGRSADRNAFMIWTHNMKDTSYNDSFVAEGAPTTETFKALTLGAGVQWKEAYAAAEKSGRFVVGGISGDESVGAAGGWVTGGGHSAFSPQFGLGVDNALQFTVVVESGDHITANAYINSDLFWALRGGGACTYGVVTSVTYKTHDILPFSVLVINVNFTSPAIAHSIATEFFKVQPALADAQWGGYSSINQQGLSYTIFAPNISLAEANATVGPFLDFVKKTAGETNSDVETSEVPSFYALIDPPSSDNSTSSGPPGGGIEFASRLFTRKAQPEKLAEAFPALSLSHVAGGFVSQIDPDSVGLNPAWREAVFLAYISVSWNDGATAVEIQAQKDDLKRQIGILEDLEPGAGAYINEGSLYEPNFQHTYFGSHYDKLLAIKDRYDPNGLFVIATGVGSERWDNELHCPKA
ncbi:FAD-binding domain-containing protein [Marasmius fiardii PR-910]|nr:FAD-binding domain-containing protein [Marasmius fiardii PR-910]